MVRPFPVHAVATGTDGEFDERVADARRHAVGNGGDRRRLQLPVTPDAARERGDQPSEIEPAKYFDELLARVGGSHPVPVCDSAALQQREIARQQDSVRLSRRSRQVVVAAVGLVGRVESRQPQVGRATRSGSRRSRVSGWTSKASNTG
jgi:hypothetical protein